MESFLSGCGTIKLDASSLFNEAPEDDEANGSVYGKGMSPNLPNRPPITYSPTSNDSNNLPGFDLTAGSEWHYPAGVELRTYQFVITERCLYQNCLVCIPTGLGKTLIAAVVLHNFLRWYPTGCVVFMAPTRPLVSQQMIACRDFTGLSISGTRPAVAVELTGTTSPQQRAALWNGPYRAFFLTPQVIVNDLTAGICPATSIRCMIIDEAHKATGNHAYCQVIRLITGAPYNHRQFRVVALSATPASDLLGAQAVIANLLISHIEVRTESSPDVREYCHKRAIETIVVCLDSQLSCFKKRLCDLALPPFKRLCEYKALWISNSDRQPHPEAFAPYTLVRAREAFLRDNSSSPLTGLVLRDFRLAGCFARALELLTLYGLRPVYQYLLTNTGSSNDLAHVSGLREFISDLRSVLGVTDATSAMSQLPFVAGHPKLLKLRDVLIEHFSVTSERCLSQRGTRAIVFTQYRDSVSDIMYMLQAYSPTLRPAVFVGQSTSTSVDDQHHSRKRTTQRDQLQVMEMFREGRVNILISTCIGEEGLDVGQVDLIVCFDAPRSPSRLIQRLGRTGRKRSGRVVVLLTQGREQANFGLSMTRSNTVHNTLLQGQATRKLVLYPHNPRMVPLGVNPSPVLWKPSIHSDTDACAIQEVSNRKKYLAPPNLRFSLCEASALLSLGQVDTEIGDTFSRRYSVNRWIPLVRESFQSEASGPSTTTWHLVASLRLLELHRRGRTNAIYHAMGIRKVDMICSLSDIPASMSQFSQTASEKTMESPLATQAQLKSSPSINSSIRLFRGLVSKTLMVDPRINGSDKLNLPDVVPIRGITLEGLNMEFEKMIASGDVSSTPECQNSTCSESVSCDSASILPTPFSSSFCMPPQTDSPPAKRLRVLTTTQETILSVSNATNDVQPNLKLRLSEDLDNFLNLLSYFCSYFRRCSTDSPVGVIAHTNGESLWRWNDVPVDLSPAISIETTGNVDVNFIVFGDGDVRRCRLPHRLAKRCSVVTKRPDQVCIVAVAKSNGYIEVYNLKLLKEHYPPTLSKMVLFDGGQSILHLTISMEGALRLASTSYEGVVKLWDIWDDGNMYATLTSLTAVTSSGIKDLSKSEVAWPYNYEVTVTVWHPYGGHLFLGSKRGHGLVLEDERPFRWIRCLHHYHRISGAAYSRDGDFLLTASFDGVCTLWSVPSYAPVHHYHHMPVPCSMRLLGGANDFHVTSLALSPDSESFATLCEDAKLHIWSISPAQESYILAQWREFNRLTLRERTLVFSPCGRLLACSLGDRSLRLWSQTACVQSSLVGLCVASIRRHVVSSLLTTSRTPEVNDQDRTFSALASLPLPQPLRLLLCHGLEACAKIC
ncbi:unnamed protein product [Hydatigera taeniaeformis]|uniref:ATP-dependent DNA helicase n=1 Tax=Hydatigena taeniaeformis TaxID=6205 RepID=A0A158RDK5_HYDTA|nr:unnamed protein product [Hydatigera taeniaeformis]